MENPSGCFAGIVSGIKSSLTRRKHRVSTIEVSQHSNASPVSKSEEIEPQNLGCSCDFSPAHEKWCSLEQWNNTSELPPHYSPLEEIFNPEAVKTIEEHIDSLDKQLRELSLKIHDHPEIAFQEKYAHSVLTEFMKSHDFEVTPNFLGLETAWRATWSRGKGGRVLGFNSEMDALPGVGHACGHNLIAIGGVAAALGVKAALEKHNINGTIILLGTPAEELAEGKLILIERGAYKAMDACLMIHPSPGPKLSAGTGSALAVRTIEVEYSGHTAHAAGAPWEGRNALDAAFLAYSSISVLRQQIKPTHRVHGIVEGRNWAPNIIPDYAKMRWFIRAPTAKEVEVLTERVKNCFEAAALATACKVSLKFGIFAYDLRQNLELAEEFAGVLRRYGQITDTSVAGAVGGSTDFGNVTYEVPALHPSYAIPTVEGGGNHTRPFTASARTVEAHYATLSASKGIAITGLRVLDDANFYERVRKAFEENKTTSP